MEMGKQSRAIRYTNSMKLSDLPCCRRGWKFLLACIGVAAMAACTNIPSGTDGTPPGLETPGSVSEQIDESAGELDKAIDSATEADANAAGPRPLVRPTDSAATGLSILFIPLPPDTFAVPADVGQGNGGIPGSVVKLFKEQYKRALLSFVPLTGVLGADRLHLWTNRNRDGTTVSALVQNWESSYPLPNGWGLPQLILAMDGADGGPVYCIYPPVLDIYSQGRGNGGAAGLAGYGRPVTGSFLWWDGSAYTFAQRFSGSLIIGSLDAQGRSQGQVTLEPAPSLGASPSDLVGLLPDGQKSASFINAWFEALDRGLPQGGAGVPDGQAVYLVFAVQNEAAGMERSAGFVLQTYDQGRWAIVQALDGEMAGGEGAVLLFPPFIDALVPAHGDVGKALSRAFSVYGFPLVNSYAVPLGYLLQNSLLKTSLEKFVITENPHLPVLVQRFQRGLWVAVPRDAVPKAD